MPRKRPRPTSCLPPAQLFTPLQTRRTQTNATLHITIHAPPTPPRADDEESIEDFHSPNNNHNPIARTLLSAMNTPQSSPSPPPSPPSYPPTLPISPPPDPVCTPLLLPSAEIRTVQLALGLTPETPRASLVCLDAAAEAEARKLLEISETPTSSPPSHSHPFPSRPSSPAPTRRRRLSDVSIVTPIPNAPANPPTPAKHPASRSRYAQSPITPAPAPALFTTGAGRPVVPPPIAPVQALFTTGDGKPVVINNRKHLINASFHTSSPHTAIKCPPFAPLFSSAASVARPRAPAGGPGAEIGSLRKTLFADGRVASGAKVAAKRQDAFTRRARPPRGGGNAIRLATTPFKKPRQVARRGKPAQGGRNGGVATVCKGKLPGKFVPPLLKNGDIQCRASCHSKLHRCSFRKQTFPVPSFIDAVNCLEKCMTFVFDRQQLGHVACLPESIVVAFQFQQLSAFGVGNCLSWMHSIFPNVENKPASCVGSAAWTRLAYSLAVWKLAKLENLRQHRFRQYGPGFLSVANLVRELLRRISHEWHANKQPHLLRMLRKDSSPASHAVLIVAGIQLTHTENVSLLLSDGWYVANALLDSFLEQRVWNGNIKVGQKIAISGASLQSVQSVKPFFFGEGDELVTSAFRLHANGVFRLSQQPNLCMGIHRPSRNTSIANIVDNGGLCPAVQVVILRSYPLFYIESINRNDDSTDDKPIFVRRREEGEDEARMAHQEAARQKFVREREHQRSKGNEHVEDVEIERRNVNSVMDVMVCGTDDDPHDTALRKIVRIYNVGEALQCVLSKESQIVLFTQLWPKKSGWTCKPDGIRDVGNGSCNTRTSVHQLSFPRRLMSLTELRKCNTMVHGDEFDGVFSILHVTARDSNVASRFTYLADDTGEEISVLALELSEADSECLPRTLRFKPGLRPRFPLIGLRDAEFRAVSTEHDLVHAKATLRTSIISARALCRQEKRSTPLRIRHEQVESRMKGKEAQLEILREAVVSFASGNRRSIGAYFTSTQDM